MVVDSEVLWCLLGHEKLSQYCIRCNSFFDAYKECIPKYYSVYSPYTVWNGMERCLAQCKSRGPFIFIRLMFM